MIFFDAPKIALTLGLMKGCRTFFLFTILFAVSTLPVYTQLDSLNKTLESATDDSSRSMILKDISYEYVYSNSDLAQAKAEESLKLARKAGCRLCEVKALNMLGNVAFVISDLPAANEHYMAALRLAQELKEGPITGAVSNNLGNISYMLDNMEDAIDYYQISLVEARKEHDSLSIAETLNSMISAMLEQGDMDRAQELLSEAEIILEKVDAPWASALMNFQKGKFLLSQGRLDEAERANQLSLAYHLKVEDYYHITDNFILQGSIESTRKRLAAANSAFNSALTYARMIGSDGQLLIVYRRIADSYEKLNDFQRAYAYYKFYDGVKDSLRSKERQNDINRLRVEFKSDVQKKENELLRKDNELKDVQFNAQATKNRIILTASIGGGLLLLTFILFQIRNNRRLRGANVKITAQRDTISHQKKEITDSINYARNIQSAIIPDDASFHRAFRDFFVFYQPKDIVSGDFYWKEEFNGKHYVAVVDCTGHGVPGAMVSIVGFNILNKVLLEYGITEPAAMLDKIAVMVEDAFSKSDRDIRDGMDLALCCIDFDAGTLTYAGANNSAWMVTDNTLAELKPQKQPIGKYEFRKPFSQQTVEIKKGTWVFLGSDGYADQFGGENGKKLKSGNLKKLLTSLSDQKGTSIRHELEVFFHNWKGDFEQVDDVCVIGVRL
jgi:serine phosphatase RsbU (regulator of sigma subunit)